MKKYFLSMVAMMLVLSLVLVGCTSSPVPNDYSGADDNYSDDYYDDYDDYYEETEYEQVSNDTLSLFLELTDEEISSFRKSVLGIKVDYEDFDDKDIKKCLDALSSINPESGYSSEKIIKDKKVDKDTLLASVKENNKANNDSYYTKISDDLLSEVVGYITDTVNYNISVNPYIDLNILDHKLKNLKVMLCSDFGYALYNLNDIALGICTDATSNLNSSEFKQIIRHETNHMIQDAMVERDDFFEMNFGVCYQFKDIDLNYLYWIWYVEGAAQNSVLVQDGIGTEDSVVYDSYVTTLNCLNCALVLNSDNVYAIQQVTAQSDINAFFELFNCRTDEEKTEIIKMMAAYNLILSENDLIFSKYFFEKTNANDDTNYSKRLKSSVGQTMSKIFYNNLACRLENTAVKLGDVYSLISAFEAQLSREIWYDSIEYKGYMDDFHETYCSIQDKFFRILADDLEISEEEVHMHYINFHHTHDHGNYDNELLNEEQASFYKSRYKECMDRELLTVSEAKARYSFSREE